ncbi:MAG: PRC-barrel domain-containing protein [Nitrosopumilus sp.]|nr:PRC-barrel domain-containing protein [Nitrosopumilus sp.]
MSSEIRIKKLRGSGGYVMAKVTDDEQMKGNLGGPDLFLAPIGRLDGDKISKHFCNTCEKEFDGAPKIEFENPNEEVAENLILAEKGQYICKSCNSAIAEYREFKKQDEAGGIGNAKPVESQLQQIAEPETQAPQQIATQPGPATSVSSIEGRAVFDENANKIGIAKQVGIDSTQAMVLVLTKDDGTEGSIPWNNIKKIGEVILLGTPEDTAQPGKCSSCGFGNKEGSKFCEECGTKL